MAKTRYALLSALLLVGTTPLIAQSAGTAPAPRYGAFGIDLSARDPSIKPGDDFIRLFGTAGYPSPIGLGITPDPADPTHYVAGAGQGGLGMPNRNYYLQPGPQFDAYRAAYRNYVATMLRLAGLSDPETRADGI